jgi:omega-6 fatty acid desaturase (delta-12 desaturase)
VWVLAHECGHQAFSESKLVNDTVGWFLHSALLVPYHSWRITHGHHHKHTCSMEHDEVFVPHVRSAFRDTLDDSTLVNALQIIVMVTVGWPGYIIANFSGPAKYQDKPNSHFNPKAALFSAKQYLDIVVSDIGFFLAVAAILYSCYVFGAATVFCFYFVPYLVNNFFLVTITYLQHTDTYVPHYREGAFTWIRGALSTVDRPLGVIDHWVHNISDTHVVHHLFSQMPHYHAQEATEAVKKVLGDYYMVDRSPFLPALWRAWCACKYVDDQGDVLFLKSGEDFRAEQKEPTSKKAN